MPRVYNKRQSGIPKGAVYVGRPTRWGNPFVIGRDGNREEVIRKYYEHLLEREDLRADLDELRGKDLVCWCAPAMCHADALLKLANIPEQDGLSTIRIFALMDGLGYSEKEIGEMYVKAGMDHVEEVLRELDNAD